MVLWLGVTQFEKEMPALLFAQPIKLNGLPKPECNGMHYFLCKLALKVYFQLKLNFG